MKAKKFLISFLMTFIMPSCAFFKEGSYTRENEQVDDILEDSQTADGDKGNTKPGSSSDKDEPKHVEPDPISVDPTQPADSDPIQPSDPQPTQPVENKVFRINFRNYDGTILSAVDVNKGLYPVYSGSEPRKPSTNTEEYIFIGWNPIITVANCDKDYYAVFESRPKKYRIKFLSDDGSLLQEEEYTFGEIPSCPDPTKESTNDTVYAFTGWEPSIVEVKNDATYVATFSSSIRKYRVTFYNRDLPVLSDKEYEYGDSLEYDGTIPTKNSLHNFGKTTNYEFVGWSRDKNNLNVNDAITELPEVTEEIAYYAVFKSDIISDFELEYSSYIDCKYRTASLFDARKYSSIANELVWTSSDTSVATVDNKGVVTPKKKGKSIITATASDGISRQCEYEVIDVDIIKVQGFYNTSGENTTIPWTKLFNLSNNDILTKPFPLTREFFIVDGDTDSFNYYCDFGFYGMAISTVKMALTIRCWAIFIPTNSRVEFYIYGGF